MTQCAKIIVGFIANVGNVFYPTFTNFFYFLHVFTFLTFFLIFINVYYIYIVHANTNTAFRSRIGDGRKTFGSTHLFPAQCQQQHPDLDEKRSGKQRVAQHQNRCEYLPLYDRLSAYQARDGRGFHPTQCTQRTQESTRQTQSTQERNAIKVPVLLSTTLLLPLLGRLLLQFNAAQQNEF